MTGTAGARVPNPLRGAPYDALPGPYATPVAPDGTRVSPAVRQLVNSQVQALLDSSASFHALPAEQRQRMAEDLAKIASYTAALVQEDFALSKRLGQTPVLRQETVLTPLTRDAAAAGAQADRALAAPAPVALAEPQRGPAADEFSPRAANQVGRITQETLNAIAFPTFVADLIKGTFNAIVDASIQQMEAFGTLLANVAKTVDQFMSDNITDNQARDYLAAQYPGHFSVETTDRAARVRVRREAGDLPPPNFRTDLGLSEDVELDDSAAEEKLVPAARRKLAQSRHQLLATMVLMGINRIVVTSGRIAAKMGFRIATKDRATAQSASQFDWKNETAAAAGWLGFGVATRNTVAYVSSQKKDSSDEIDVHADLTGEVDLKFKSETFPLERFADAGVITTIQGNTPNPAANTPTQTAGGGGGGAGGQGG
jgi:hypothetical protein